MLFLIIRNFFKSLFRINVGSSERDEAYELLQAAKANYKDKFMKYHYAANKCKACDHWDYDLPLNTFHKWEEAESGIEDHLKFT